MLSEDLSERQHDILGLLGEAEFATIDSLAARFNVTTQTVRRDVNDLRDRGLLTRVHTGVRRLEAARPYASRAAEQTEAKAALAREAARLIPDGASVSIGIGSTPAEVARILATCGAREIVTNNLAAASMLWDIQEIGLRVCGGTVTDRGVTGPAAVEFFQGFRVDVAVYGVAGVDDDGALLDFREGEVNAREAMRRNARQSLLVMDSVKFQRRALARGGWLLEADTIVTNGPVPASLAQAAGSRLVSSEQAQIPSSLVRNDRQITAGE